MPLQISPQAFKWLQTLALAKEAKRNHNAMMEINEQTALRLADGHSIGLLLISILKGKDDDKTKKLEALKENSTPAIRLYNWGILAEVLKQLGYTLEYAEKSKLTNQDPEPLSRLFAFLCELRSKDPQTKGEENALKVDINEIAKKGSKDAVNALEFLTILISKHFKISPQQTLNLFLDNNKYLSHLLAKGVKNSFEPIYHLLNDIKAHAEFLVQHLFCIDEEQNVNFALNALRTCLIGKDELTAVLFCEILMQIYHQYRLGGANLQVLRNWVKNEGINTLFFGIKKQPLLMGSIIEICYSYLDDEFFKFIQLSEKSILWSTDREKLVFYKNFAEETSTTVLEKFMISNYFDEWNRMMLKVMKKTKDNYETLLLIAIMEVQWSKLAYKFEQHDLAMANNFINFLKTVLASESELLFVQSCRTLFSLMHTLGSVKNPFAPLIYKILTTTFSSMNDCSRIAFISDNFTQSFKGISGLPGAALVQPLLKHLEKNLDYSVMNLCQTLIVEKRISDDESLDLIEMFTKILFQDIRFGSVILQAIFQGLPYISDDLANSFLENNVKLSLAQLYSSSKAITKTIKALKEELARIEDIQGKGKAAENFVNIASKHIICKNLVGFIAKAILIDQTLKKDSESAIFHTFIKIKVELKKTEQAELLRPVMTTYYEDEQLEERITYYMNKLFPPKPKIEPPPPEKPHNHNHDHSDHDHISKSVSLRPSTQDEKQTAIILDPSILKPSSFAIRDLEKLKQKRYELKTLEQEKQKEKLMKAEKIEKFKTIQHEKRLIESMTTIKNDVEYNHLQTLDTKDLSETRTLNTSLNKQTKELKEMNVVGIKLVNLEKEEEDTYRQDAESIMRKYRKVWRYLFYKYSSKKQEGGGEEKAHMGEAWKMLKEYQFSFLKKEECFTIVRLVNQNLKRKNDIQFLTYNGFEDFILQSAIIGYSKQGYTHIPPGQQLLLFIEQLKKITKDKSGSVQIFDNPEEAYFQQTEVIREFNKRLKENPDYILPEGYKRIKQTTLEYEYDFHPMLQKNLSSSYVSVLEVLDSIFVKHPSFGFHIIEPLTIKSEVYLAKPVLFQNLSQKMKDYKQGYLNPKRSISATANDKDDFALPSPPIKKQFKPYINFSLGIKLGIAETSLKNKSIAEEVAYCMEDILNAIQNQSPVVRKGNKRRIVNEYMKRKKTEIAKIETQRKREEVNWKKRAESVKLEVEALREKRKETEKQKKKKQYLDKKAKKQRQDKIYRERLQEFEKVKAKIAEKKETLMELKAQEEEKIRKEKEEYKIGVEEYFRKMKQFIKDKEEDYKRKKNQQKEKKEESEQKSKEFVKKLYLNNLKKEEEVLEKIDEIKQAYQQTWKSDEVQKLFNEKKQSLKLLFDLLLKYQKSKISATNYDEIGVATLNYFCLKFKIIPFMLQKHDVSKIYMYAIKESEDQKRKGIDFEKFQEVLFLIAVKAKKILNKLIEKRKKKEKKMQAFLNAQKSGSGNHFEAKHVDESSSEEQIEEQEQEGTLQDEYLFNAENVNEETVDQVISFLKLPADKAAMEQRYKQAMETKTSKPRNQLIKEIKESLDQQ